MAASISQEPSMPWVDYQEDKSFRWIAVVFLLLFLGAGMVLNAIKLPEVAQKNLVDVSPRLAQLILEKKKVKPPPELKKEVPKKEEKKKEPEKKKEKPKEEKKPEVKKEKPSAREVAKQSGLIALSDELNDLRESFDLDQVLELPQQSAAKEEVKVASTSDLLSSTASKSSGGIKTDTLNRTVQNSELSQRKTTSVTSKIESNEQKLSNTATRTASLNKRNADEIERVFQQNKGAIFSIYNRALRKNPSLAGQVVIELTIAANGSITAARIVSSELGDESLERKLLLKIKRFKFASANVPEITVTYPIDFLPS